MHILLSNDDGISAPGLRAVYKYLTKLGKVTVVAPSQVQSGASHSITLEPLTCYKVTIEDEFTGYAVDGAPADCVKLGLMELIDIEKEPIDLVVSGMNYGANAGIYVHYSGTVAAAREAAFYGIPAIALSATRTDDMDFDAAAEHCYNVIKKLMPLRKGDLISVNIPVLSENNPKGVKVLANSTNCYEEDFIYGTSDDGHKTFQYLGGPHTDQPDVAADTIALHEGYITVTALHFEITDYKRNRELETIDFEIPKTR